MMPYVVTTKRPVTSVSPFLSRGSFERDSLPVVSRRAVATLEEETLHGALVAAVTNRETRGRAVAAILALPESGGTIGPLPDGTVIEVKRVSWDTLAAATPNTLVTSRGNPVPRTESEVIAAFNAREGRLGEEETG